MPLPFAAIAGTAISVGSAALAKRQEMVRAAVQRGLGSLARTGRDVAVSAGGQIVGAGVINSILNPGVPGAGGMMTAPSVSRSQIVQSARTGRVTVSGGGFGTAPRRYRRMNVANVKALRRAGRRVEGFVKLAKSLISMPGARSKHPIKGRRRRR